ncbi:MAG TPA: RNA polymerase sigma factor [Polyangiaceae bacterium]|nr:RNA polymerase sigma factor [Polyangiaceae bacterium]
MERLVELYVTHSSSVRARCRAVLRDPVLAEDATQETFLRVHRHLTEVESVTDVEAWILRIATNYCLNELRNRARVQSHGREFEPVEGNSDERTLLARDLLRRILCELPVTQQALLGLHYFDGLEQRRIAGVLGVSRRTVVSRMAELRHDLQRWQNAEH